MRKILPYAFLNALGTALYVVLVASFMFSLERIFADTPDNANIMAPVAMLMLLVFSVALVGSLIFGRAVIWYSDGKKKEAVYLVVWTLGILFVITIIVILILIGVNGM